MRFSLATHSQNIHHEAARVLPEIPPRSSPHRCSYAPHRVIAQDANRCQQSGQNRETERAKVPVECQAGHVTKPLPHDYERERIAVGEASSRGQTSKDLKSGGVVGQVGNNHFDSRHDIPGARLREAARDSRRLRA